MGSHTPGHNHRSIGLCLIGGLDHEGKHSADFTPIQMSALKVWAGRLLTAYPGARLVGHSEVQKRRGGHAVCPAIDMTTLRKEIDECSSDRC